MAIRTCELNADGCLQTENLRSWAGMVVCELCYQKEQDAQKELRASAEQRVTAANDRTNVLANALKNAQTLDASINVRTELFNAATESIVNLKAAIDADDTITNKPFALASTLTDRFEHFKKVVFDLSEQIVQANNEQKAIQVYLNNLANQLRAEEREKLKIADINYKPATVKPIKPAAIRTAKKKLDKAELRKYASELGISEFTLQMMVVSQGLTVEEAANKLRKSINEAKSETTN